VSKIRKGDQVVVLSGKDKGRQGQVLQVVDGTHVIVENINKVKKHQKGNPNQPNQQGGIIEKEMPLPVSKVAIWNTGAKRADRIGYRSSRTGRRFASSSRTARCSTRKRVD
jgi:large subunit ribosomal protein L24